MTTLRTRPNPNRGDLIQMFKIVKEIEVVSWNNEPTWSTSRGRTRSQIRREIIAACQQRFNFFLNRVANVWNELPDEIVESDSTANFKCKLDEYISRRPLLEG